MTDPHENDDNQPTPDASPEAGAAEDAAPADSASTGVSAPAGEPNVVMCILAYLGPLALVPYLVEKDDEFIQWHARQGIVFLIANVVLSIAVGIIAVVTCGIGSILYLPLSIATIVFAVMAIIKACKGERWPIPVIGKYIEKIPPMS